jgi:hypothetical protein
MKISILIALLCLLAQCSNDKSKIEVHKVYESLYNQNLSFSDSLLLVTEFGNTSLFEQNFPDENLKIVSLISAECWKCIDEIKKWEKLCSQYQELNKIQFYFIFHYVEIEYFKKNQFPELPHNSNFNYILDVNNSFLSVNLLPENKIFHTFLLNHSNKVEILGSPFFNERLKNLYVKKITSETIR